MVVTKKYSPMCPTKKKHMASRESDGIWTNDTWKIAYVLSVFAGFCNIWENKEMEKHHVWTRLWP